MRIQIVILILLTGCLFLFGCERYIESDPIRTLPEEPPVPINLVAHINDRSVMISWDVSDSIEIRHFRLYKASSGSMNFEQFDSTEAFQKEITDLPHNQSFDLRVTTLSTSGVESDFSSTINITLGLLSISIENGDEYTNSRDVFIQLNVPGSASYVTLSEDPDFSDGAIPQSFQSQKRFTLSSGDGLKTVYAKFIFTNGSESDPAVTDDITLDTYARIKSVTFAPTGTSFSQGDSILFLVDADNEIGGNASVSFSSINNVTLNDDGLFGDVVAEDAIYSSTYIVPIGLTVNNDAVFGDFTDAAGNTATQVMAEDSLLIITNDPPTGVSVAVGLVDSVTARLSWTRNDDPDFESYRIYRDTNAGVGTSDQLITIITNQTVLNYNDYLPSAGTYYYRVFVFDVSGLSTGSDEVDITR